MDPETEKKILQLLTLIAAGSTDLEHDARNWGREILTHLIRINTQLSTIDRSLTLLEMKE